MTKSRGINRPKTDWTEQRLAQLQSCYPNEPTQALANRMGLSYNAVARRARRLNLQKTQAFLSSELSGRTQKGKPHPGSVDKRFQPGIRPWNTGLKGVFYGDPCTQFKPGSAPANRQELGALRITTLGDIEIKLSDVGKGQWVSLRRYVWEMANGPIPPGMCIGVRDHDPHNTQLGNLMLLTRAENIRHNWLNRYPKSITQTAQLIGRVKGKIRKLQEQSHAHQ